MSIVKVVVFHFNFKWWTFTPLHFCLYPQSLCSRRVLRNNRNIPPHAVISRGHPIKFGGIRQCSNIYSVKLGIPAPHVAQTNAGYSRREDGVLYNVWNSWHAKYMVSDSKLCAEIYVIQLLESYMLLKL